MTVRMTGDVFLDAGDGADGGGGARRGRLRFRAAAARVARERREETARVRSDAGPGATMAGTSLWAFGPRSRARAVVFRVVHSQTMEYVILALIITHFAALVLLASSGESSRVISSVAELTRSPLRALDVAVTCAYTVEAAARIFALGFIGHKHAYMASVYNQVDLVIVVASWMSMALQFRGSDSLMTRVRFGQLRLFRGVHALKRFKLATSVVFIAESLQKSISLLRDVAGITVVCAVFYALMGMGIFGGSLRRRCVETANSSTAELFYTAVSDPELFCGDVSNVLNHKGYVCPGVYDSNSSLFCSDMVGNPQHGYQSFDSFGSTLLVMFQTITIEAWQEVMFPIVNAEYKASAAYFVTLIIIGTYFIVSVFVAGVSGVFLRLRKEHQLVLRSASSGRNNGDSEDLESEIAVRKLIRRLNGGTGESFNSVAEAAMLRKRLLEEDACEETTAIPSGVAQPKRDRLSAFINNAQFDKLIKFCIAVNISVMAMYRFDLSIAYKQYIAFIEGFFLSAFMLEIILRGFAAKHLARRIATFKLSNEDAMLIFDAVVVGVSAMVIWGKGMNLTSLRIPRLFKTFGAAKPRSGADTIHRVFRSLGSLFSLFLFYVAVLAMYAVLGMQLFANRGVSGDDAPRLNYDTFPQAMLAVFVTSTGEGWTELMYHGVQITEAAIPFYISFFILVNYIILNLVIAVVLENLELRDVEKTIFQSRELVKRTVKSTMRNRRFIDLMEQARVKSILTLRGRRWTTERVHRLSPWLASRWEVESGIAKAVEEEIAESLSVRSKEGTGEKTTLVMCESTFVHMKTPAIDARVDMAPAEVSSTEDFLVCSKSVRAHDPEIGARVEMILPSAPKAPSGMVHGADSDDVRKVKLIFDDAASDASDLASSAVLPWYITDKSLWIFPSSGEVRKRIKRMLRSNIYERVSFIVVMMSIIAVLATKPVDQENRLQMQVDAVNFAVCGFFLFDFALNVTAHGFMLTPSPFLGRIWNLLDLGILVIDVMIVGCPVILGASYTRYWRRAFNMAAPVRPVRIMTRVKSMQRLVKSLAVTLPTIGSIIMLTGGMFLAFAVIGVREYGGTFYSCNDATVSSKLQCVGTFVDIGGGDIVVRKWYRNLFEFDWIGSAMLTLLETASLDGWTEVMFAAMDKTGIDLQPQFERNWSASFYFVTFILLGSFLMIRTIIGVFIHHFGMISGRKLLTERQKLWHDMHKVAVSLKPIRAKVKPPRGIRRYCFAIVNHEKYRSFVLLSVSLNAALMATERYGDNGTLLARVRAISEMCFVSIYSVEVLLQVAAAYPRVNYYFSNKWNAFELFLAAGSAATLRSKSGSVRDQIGRPFRFLRVFRVIRHVQSLQILANTLVLAVPSILSVMGLMLIWMFMYAGIGTQVFSNVKYGVALNKDANFQSFTSSFLLLFQVVTGEGWRQYMYDLMVNEPYCADVAGPSDCGFPDGAVLYFVTYVIAMGYVFTNLFVASILDHVTFGVLRESAVVTPKHLYDFQEAWSLHDPNATGFIGVHRLGEFLRDLGTPLAVDVTGKLANKSKIFRDQAMRAASLWRRRIAYEAIVVREPGRGVPFTQLLESLLATKLGASALALEARLTRRRRLRDIDHWAAAVVTQAHVRGFIVRRRLRIERSRLKALDAARCATRASRPGEVTHWDLDC